MQSKQCKQCGEVKPVEHFYRHPDTCDGRLNQCKECKKSYEREKRRADVEAARERQRAAYQRNKTRILQKQRQYAQQNRERIRTWKKEYYEENKAKISAYHQQWYSDNREQVSQRVLDYQKTPEGKAVRRRAEKRYKDKYPEKARAHRAVSNAIRDGKLVREDCEICGSEAEAHHEDYSQPLDVRWMCFRHHREIAHGHVVMRDMAR